MGNEIFVATLKGGKNTKKEGNITPEQVPWEKFYLSICGSFQTGGTLFPLQLVPIGYAEKRREKVNGKKKRKENEKKITKLDSYDSNKGKQIQHVLLTHAH